MRKYGCPYCGQSIDYEQVICSHCGGEVEWVKVPQQLSK
jgi:uncharacterized OB-fold protein